MAVIYGPLTPPSTVYLLLNTISTYLRDYITTDLRNENFFSYTLDGNSIFISDGGNDMFDSGNYTAPWVLAGTDYTAGLTIASPPAINYANTTSTLIDTSFYYASLGYSTSPDRRPLTVLGSRSEDGVPVGFQKAGNIGADGGGQLDGGDVYTGTEINGFTTHAYYRQTYGQASDPAICDLYMLLGHANWGTTFGTINKFANSNKGIQGAYFYASGATRNILAIATLLSRPSPSPIPLSAVQTVVSNYTLRIKEALGY